jgi:Spy/CpxP family protein refolding chaperone
VKRLLLAAGLVSALGSVATAQPARRQGGPPDREAREELFKMVDAYVVSNLQESLGLTDEQFVKLLPAVRRLQSVRREFVEKRRDRLSEIRHLLESGTGTEARISELMKELKAAELEEPAAVRREVDAVDAQLTPVQQAKLRLMEARVEQRLREYLRRGQGPGPHGRRPDGGTSPSP